MHPDADYYASTDITNKGIEWVRSQCSLRRINHFFYYSAIGTHGPFRCPRRRATDTKASSTRAGTRSEGNTGPAAQNGHRPRGHGTRPKATRDSGMGPADSRWKKVFARYMEMYPLLPR